MTANDAMLHLQRHVGENKGAVIYVDDEPPMRRLYERNLKVLLPDLEIRGAIDGQEALEAMLGDCKDRVLAILSDVDMPLIPGDELMDIISSPDENGEILMPSDEVVKVLITGNPNRRSIDALIREGKINQVMEKPFDIDGLERVILDSVREIMGKAEGVRKFL